jgi:hypothetical protein
MSDETVRAYLQQLQKVIDEDKRLAKQRKELGIKKKELEAKIQEYISERNVPGVKYDSLTVIANQKKVRNRMKKEEKISNGCKILENLGISNSKEALAEIIKSMKGNVTLEPGLKIKYQKEEKKD